MRAAFLFIVLAVASFACVFAEPREADSISAFERALDAMAMGHMPEHIAEARSRVRTMTTACDPGTPCALCGNEMDHVTDGFIGTCYYSFSRAGENSASSRDFYCTNQCYRFGIKYLKVIRGANCQAFLASVPSNSLGALTLTSLAADMAFACVKNPASGSYCSVALSSPPFNSSLSFSGGVNSPGCAALNDLGCCWQSLLNFLNSTGSLATFGMSSRGYALSTNSAICGLDLAPACPVPGVATKFIEGVIAIRNLNISYVVTSTRFAVYRALARAIYNSILNHTSVALNLAPASVLITGLSALVPTQSAFRTQVATSGVSVSFRVQAPTPEDTDAAVAPTQAAMASPVLDSLNADLPSAAKYNTADSFSADPSASTAASVTTPDSLPSAAPSLIPSLSVLVAAAISATALALF